MKTPHFLPNRYGASVFSTACRLFCLVAVLAVIFATMSGCKKKEETDKQSKKSNTTSSETTTVQKPTDASTTEPKPAPQEGIPKVGWCNVENGTSLHVRKGPGQDYYAIGGLHAGEKVTIVGREGDWFKIKFKDDYAYVSASYIQDTEYIPTDTTTSTPTTTSK